MRRFFRCSLLVFVVLMLISSTSFANLKKARIGSGSVKVYEFTPFTDGVTSITVIYDKAATDLDLAVGLEDGTLIAASISPDDHFETLHVGLVRDITYILVVESFEGPATSFRLIVNNGEQGTISSAGAIRSGTTLREIESGAIGSKLEKTLRNLQKVKK
ncbi:hypothetical protein L0222_23390 [bacterium]|nr:hypothetical protein [bacterium]MCI0601931.1 hypothetical protein [bacterium]